ncbi:MAG: chromosomal replication initiator protein DnaA [Bacilli bacterium]|nr:chromosomal replication initiator protein DnaA [Bacilli bacterium]
MSMDKMWNSFLNKVRSKNVSVVTLNSIFCDLKLHSYENGIVKIIVPNDELFLQRLEKSYGELIKDTFEDITNDICDIHYIYEKDINNTNNIDKKEQNYEIIDNIEQDITNYTYKSNFNPEYTFDTFIVGESNKQAYLTARQIAEKPGIYNPFFLYAKSGLGKTHLLHAIGNYIVTHSDKKVLYVRAEQFITDYTSIMSLKNKNIDYLKAFRDKYRNVDILMVDDIQYLEHKEKTQIEFTNTIETLHNEGKQIIIATDKPINEKYLEERLMTRLIMGLTETIRPPEFELKKNIIKNKILLTGFELNISEDAIDYIANNCGSSVRSLTGTVTRIAFYASMFNLNDITIDIAKDALVDFVDTPIYKSNSCSKIIDVVAKYFELDSSIIKGKMRKKNISDARAIAMYLCRILTTESLERIGLEIGGRDHSTVIHSYEKVSNELKTNIKLQEEIRILKERLTN